jgi:hypothetical protein
MQTIQRAVETSTGAGSQSSDPRKESVSGHSASAPPCADRRLDTGDQVATPSTCNVSHRQRQSTDEGKVGCIIPLSGTSNGVQVPPLRLPLTHADGVGTWMEKEAKEASKEAKEASKEAKEASKGAKEARRLHSPSLTSKMQHQQTTDRQHPQTTHLSSPPSPRPSSQLLQQSPTLCSWTAARAQESAGAAKKEPLGSKHIIAKPQS